MVFLPSRLRTGPSRPVVVAACVALLFATLISAVPLAAEGEEPPAPPAADSPAAEPPAPAGDDIVPGGVDNGPAADALGPSDVVAGEWSAAVPQEFGEIRGTVRDYAGGPLAGITVWARLEPEPRSPWETQEEMARRTSSSILTTNEAGEFRFQRMTPGRYTVWSEKLVDGQLLRDHARVAITAGAAAEPVALTFVSFVSLSGSLRVAGSPPPAKGFAAELVPVGSKGEAIQIAFDAEGRWSAIVRPGIYRLAVTAPVFGRKEYEEQIAVAAEPREQLRDFELDAAEVDVVVHMPAGRDFVPGTLTAEYLTSGNSLTTRVQMATPRVGLGLVLAGTYEVGASLENGLMGQSDLVTVGTGCENVLHVTVGEPTESLFAGRFLLPPGRHEYKFYAPPDVWIADALNPQRLGEGVFTNSVVSVPGGAVDAEGHRAPWPAVEDESGEVTFLARAATPRRELYLRSSHGNWRVDTSARLEPVAEKTYEARLRLEPGRYEYKFHLPAENRWWLDPTNPEISGEGALLNTSFLVLDGGGIEGARKGRTPEWDDATGEVVFRVTLAAYGDDVKLLGSFNDWKMDEAIAMTPAGGDAPAAEDAAPDAAPGAGE